MAKTRSEVHREYRIEQTEVDGFTDDDDDASVADHYQRSRPS